MIRVTADISFQGGLLKALRLETDGMGISALERQGMYWT